MARGSVGVRRGSVRALVASLAAVAASLLGPGDAHAQAPTDQDKAAATALFDQAKALLAGGNVREACGKLEESRRLAPLPGTVLNLAACHEREGLTASAVAEFREARAMAERDGRADRVAFADEHLRAIEPHLSLLVIVVPTTADLPELVVARDGVQLGRPAWGTPIPVDPGTHVVEASAPGKKAERIEITVKADGDRQTATLVPLEDVTPAAPTPPPPPPPAAIAPAPPPAPRAVEVPAPRQGLSTRRVWALVVSGAGLAAAGVGAGFGVDAISKHGAPGATCNANPCSQTSKDLNGWAGRSADFSTGFFVGAAVAVGVGAFLWFGDSVAVSPGVGRLDVVGRF